jgi:membrane protein YqaA with SNARE-associated domain
MQHAALRMMIGTAIAAAAPTTLRSVRHWIFHLGGLGLIPLGLLDNSPIPLPGIMDVATILLAGRQQQLWLYYAVMATLGSVLGGFVTYRLARKGGKEALERRFTRRKVDRVCEMFERWGFSAIAIPAFLPPPMPMVPFLLAAGAMQYPSRKFLLALTLGRLARYMVIGYLAARYGRKIIVFMANHGHPVAVGIVLLVIAAAAAGYYFWSGSTRKKRK